MVDAVAMEYRADWREVWTAWTLDQLLLFVEAMHKRAERMTGTAKPKAKTMTQAELFKSDFAKG